MMTVVTMVERRPKKRRTRWWEVAVLALALGFLGFLGSVVVMGWRNHRPTVIRPEDVARAMAAPRMAGTHPCVFATFSRTVKTGVGQCATSTGKDAGAVDRVEVDLRYGAFVLRQTDLLLDDVFAVPLMRAYRSQDWTTVGRSHAFGRNSNDSFDIAPEGDGRTSRPDGKPVSLYDRMELVMEDGDSLDYPRISEGAGYANAVFLHTETSTRFYKSTIAWNGHGWTLRLADGTQMLFPDAYGAKTMAWCGRWSEVNAAGERLQFERDAQRNVRRVTTPHGRWMDLSYDRQGRVTQAVDDHGRTVRYAYDGNGMLASAVASTGAERHYEYSGVLMTGIRDEHGTLLVRNRYQGQVLVEQRFANGDSYLFTYVWSPSERYAERVTVSGPDGTTKTIAVMDSVPGNVQRGE